MCPLLTSSVHRVRLLRARGAGGRAEIENVLRLSPHVSEPFLPRGILGVDEIEHASAKQRFTSVFFGTLILLKTMLTMRNITGTV
jgi:hypothetical protein